MVALALVEVEGKMETWISGAVTAAELVVFHGGINERRKAFVV